MKGNLDTHVWLKLQAVINLYIITVVDNINVLLKNILTDGLFIPNINAC